MYPSLRPDGEAPVVARRAASCPARIAALVLGLAFGTAGAGDLLPLTAEQLQSLGVQTGELGTHAGAVASGLPARVVVPPTRVAVLAAPVAGMVQRVDKTHNEQVQPDEPVLALTSAALVDDQLSLFKAASQHRLAAENATRDERLLKDGIIPESRSRTARAEEQRALAEVRALRERLRLSGLDAGAIRRAEEEAAVSESVAVRSPIAGTITELRVVPGTRVEVGAALAEVADLSRLWLEIQVPVGQARLVELGQPVKVVGAGVGGAVTMVESEISGAETVKVRAEVEAAGRVRPGQAVEVWVGAAADARQWRVPAAALVWQAGKPFLFVQVPEGFRAQPVTVLSQSAATAGVTGELKGDERIATRGVAALKSIWLGGAEAAE
jgi:multidrug efflux pump subunit AcrA (membrane-fusion protein)